MILAKIMLFTRNSWKARKSFPEDLGPESPFGVTQNHSQGVIFIMFWLRYYAERIWDEFFYFGPANFRKIAGEIRSEFWSRVSIANHLALFFQVTQKIHAQNSRPELSAFLSNFTFLNPTFIHVDFLRGDQNVFWSGGIEVCGQLLRLLPQKLLTMMHCHQETSPSCQLLSSNSFISSPGAWWPPRIGRQLVGV